MRAPCKVIAEVFAINRETSPPNADKSSHQGNINLPFFSVVKHCLKRSHYTECMSCSQSTLYITVYHCISLYITVYHCISLYITVHHCTSRHSLRNCICLQEAFRLAVMSSCLTERAYQVLTGHLTDAHHPDCIRGNWLIVEGCVHEGAGAGRRSLVVFGRHRIVRLQKGL